MIFAALLMTGIAASSATSPHCDDSSHRAWLSACLAIALNDQAPNEPWFHERSVLRAGDDLTESLVAACARRDGAVVAPEAARSELHQLLATAEGCSLQEHRKWLAGCVNDVMALSPGKTRTDVLQHFRPEGGFGESTSWTFYHHTCDFLHVVVHFRLTTNAETPEDVITAVDPPYLTRFHEFD